MVVLKKEERKKKTTNSQSGVRQRNTYPWHYCEEASFGGYCSNTDNTGNQVWWAKGFLGCPYPCHLQGDSAKRLKKGKQTLLG